LAEVKDDQGLAFRNPDLGTGARLCHRHEGVLLCLVVMDQSLATGTANQEAQPVSGEHAVAWSLGNLRPELRLRRIELLQRGLGDRADLRLLGGLVVSGQSATGDQGRE
jgi:hypothetical protein